MIAHRITIARTLSGLLALALYAACFSAEMSPSRGLAADAGATAPGERSRIDRRYATDNEHESPDFRQHVVPLLGKLGCNGRACHGSFQGQGGFRLSLFGYDFKADHENLLTGDEPRTNLAEPLKSLILAKPLEEVDHEGGRRLEKDTWQYRVLVDWIKEGAKGLGEKPVNFVRLEVTPAELVASRKGETWQLKAVAVWSDGSREDVTPLCRFQTNNDQIVTIDQAGLVTAAGPGDSHVVAFYDNGVVPVPVIFPVSDQVGPKYPPTPTPTRIDELVVEKLAKLGEVQAPLCSDEDFLRRVSLDIAGTPPAPDEVEAFLADTRGDKRARKIDELLERPGYAAWWATRFCDWTGNNSQVNQNNGPDRRNIASRYWYEWIRSRIAKNVPYDEIVEGIVLARSRLDDETYAEYCERMSRCQSDETGGSFAEQPYLPYYWSRSNFRTNEERALGFAYAFLGVRIQCAQCHKHPFDQWTKDDFDRFENFFARVRFSRMPLDKDEKAVAEQMLVDLGIDTDKLKGNKLDGELEKLRKAGKVVPYGETAVVAPPKPVSAAAMARKNLDKEAKKRRDKLVAGRTATVLGGEEFKIDEIEDPREVLMDWMRDEDNPYFARAIVNRVWAAYFNVGIVEPPDDHSLANPPSNEKLLDYLTAQFRSHGYDLKWLHREIANSRTYQLSWQTNPTNRLDERNFARAVPRRIPAEIVYDAVKFATASDPEAAKLRESLKGRAIADPIVAPQGGSYALTVFGRSIRESNCDCDRSMEPSLLQTVFLKNDAEMLGLIDRRGGWLDQIIRSPTTAPTSEAGDRAAARRRAERLVDALQEKLAKAKQRNKPELVREAEIALASARKRAADLRATTGGDDVVAPVPGPGPDADEVAAIVKQAYLRTLSRLPTAAEQERAAGYFREAGDVRIAARDLLWALLNTKEFVVNH
jgi:hypothetical protein